jgi:hypothetical protein
VKPNVETTRSTIRQPLTFLLLEAHRRLDERRAGRNLGARSAAD